jgi:hypothetical protein
VFVPKNEQISEDSISDVSETESSEDDDETLKSMMPPQRQPTVKDGSDNGDMENSMKKLYMAQKSQLRDRYTQKIRTWGFSESESSSVEELPLHPYLMSTQDDEVGKKTDYKNTDVENERLLWKRALGPPPPPPLPPPPEDWMFPLPSSKKQSGPAKSSSRATTSTSSISRKASKQES